MKVLRSALPSTGVTTMSEFAMVGSGYHVRRAGTVEHKVAIRFTAAVVGPERADLQLETPALAVASDAQQMIARPAILAAPRRGRRGDAQHRHRALRAGDARDLAAMVVAVQDRLAADPANHRLES